jgi:hypothetical protein
MSEKKPKKTTNKVHVRLGKQIPVPKPVNNETSASTSSNSEKKK